MLIASHKKLIALVSALLLTIMMVAPAVAVAPAPGAFERTWSRTDKPVADDVVDRTWIWGPEANTEVMQEEYADSPGGMRDVQYFDKSRMEINHPDAPDDGLWYVTNGLLVVELMTGMMQVGDEEFVEHAPAEVNIAGDPGFAETPTYSDYAVLADAPAFADGSVITATVDGDGNVGDDDSLAEFNVTADVLSPETGHRTASVFWDFMVSSGTVYEGEEFVTDRLFENAYYATGLPVTEAYWSQVMVLGSPQWVLTQAFERRVLTYTPTNNEGFQVEAGNVGLHYYQWRYETEPPPPPPPDRPVGEQAYAELQDAEGTDVGWATFTETEEAVDVVVEVTGLEPGTYGTHIHMIGLCEAPDFTSAGDHFNPFDAEHGLENPEGPHAGDLPNLEVGEDGTGTLEYSNSLITLGEGEGSLFDEDGSALMIHAGADDHMTDPSGNSGDRIACGVITAGELPDPDPEPEVAELSVMFGALNESGVSGTANLTLEDGQLTVAVEASGLVPDEEHMMHIHGPEDGSQSICPTPDMAGEDGVLSIDEGLPAYGPPMLPLESYPIADGDGNISFEETYEYDGTAEDLATHTIVIHGLTVEDTYDASVPVACGLIVPDDSFMSELSGENELPEPVESEGSGFAVYHMNEAGDAITFVLAVNGLADVTAAHIHLQDEGEDTGGVVAPLFGTEEEAGVASDGVLASGQITQDDLTGALEGMTLEDLMDAMVAGETYTNVHTVTNPSGEIRGQIEAQGSDPAGEHVH